MKIIQVALGPKSYPVYIGSGLLAQAGRYLSQSGFSGKLVIITDPVVNQLYGEVLNRRLAREGFQVSTLLVPPGEAQKSLETAGRLYHELAECHAERTTPILALGGGVIGDLAGFVAATYLRGVPLVQLPTTLLAQVDSSVGGKVAVDHGQLKNMIGAFYQPRLVIADTDTLKTLPAEELASGLAEVIKSAVIRDEKFFSYLEQNLERIKALDASTLEESVFHSVRIKAEVVTQDELDSGLRNILNYGHTIGHALETVSGFRLKHGQAVAVGMVAAGKISSRMGILKESELSRLKRVLEQAELPTEMPRLKVAEIMQAMQHDKKVRQGKVRFVLLKSIGNVFITDEVELSLVEQVLRE
ncbi:MAG TPA: 3-dehydroquinate synthase [Dehalococcoidia bacterium]|jgi:3-dehydroquinate synthase|nr:3-dehydroquinate synthase [Dehalococcoidia bacterium]